MTEITINTAQNVAINFKPASLGERIVAFAIDMVIKIAYVSAIYYFIIDLLNLNRFLNSLDAWESGVVYFVLFIPFIFYTLFFESWTNGQTPGKMMMKIRVVKLEGYQARFSDYFSRWVCRLVDILIFMGLPAILGIIFSKKSQRIGDMVTDTTVISLKSNVQLNHRFLDDLSNEYVVTFPTVLRLSDHDMNIIKKAYNTAIIQNDYEMITKLIAKIEEVTTIKNQNFNQHQFIQTIINDFNHLTSK
ncbi:RDD family protein [Flavobacterium sp. CBA20B-1]|uniref:RDD family protein n=1 Tax=unclassified Flavobacterium TaxID=196869 RepID=UPI00222529E6|nr:MULTISPECIES: RDD family protein [unclassified Flavobacterium]WCM42651.1 RDD family protein [Flavobacterium sp. CBA20B-1]